MVAPLPLIKVIPYTALLPLIGWLREEVWSFYVDRTGYLKLDVIFSEATLYLAAVLCTLQLYLFAYLGMLELSYRFQTFDDDSCDFMFKVLDT